ncbi:MAG: MBL fold metallo-hydrolase [Flavobacteriaceae bacterium]|nr:MBL fold metallo-hydrolase [Flavobacteriaceae bacterium]
MTKTVLIALILLSINSYSEEKTALFDEFTAKHTCNINFNDKFALSSYSDEWFHVYKTHNNVYSIVEPYQYQESISHLIIGENKALLFDTGIGLIPIRPIIKKITNLPIIVLHSHTHFDHVGGNWEFSDVRAIETSYTKANMNGFENKRIGQDFTDDSFCKDPPKNIDLNNIYTKEWKASSYIKNKDIIDLGNRKIEILHVPGHTPDALALLDKQQGLLFTGDTYYNAELWLYVPETNLDNYQNSIDRLVQIESKVDYIFGAHRTVRVDSGVLIKTKKALLKLRSAEYVSDKNDQSKQLFITIDGIDFVTALPVLEGKQGDTSKGGSGYDTW